MTTLQRTAPLTFKAAPRRILLISIRRLGDVLLSTVLIEAMAKQWPQARIDVLTNASAAVTLQGISQIARVIVQPERPRFWQVLGMVARIFRRYDLAVCAMGNDRPYLYAYAAAPLRAGLVPQGESSTRLKKKLMTAWCVDQPRELHVVEQYLRVGDLLGLPRTAPKVLPPQPESEVNLDAVLGAGWRERSYAVVHASAMFRYKAWTLEGWRALVRALAEKGLRVMLTGGGSPAERELVAAIAADSAESVLDLAGRLRFAELTPLLSAAKVFIGPDTSVTHLAAATGIPTITLFGPSDPVRWGPWPNGHDRLDGSPWIKTAPLQHRNNVWIVQGVAPCVPCLLEGCERKLESRSDCLEQLPVLRVLNAAEQALAASPNPSR